MIKGGSKPREKYLLAARPVLLLPWTVQAAPVANAAAADLGLAATQPAADHDESVVRGARMRVPGRRDRTGRARVAAGRALNLRTRERPWVIQWLLDGPPRSHHSTEMNRRRLGLRAELKGPR